MLNKYSDNRQTWRLMTRQRGRGGAEAYCVTTRTACYVFVGFEPAIE